MSKTRLTPLGVRCVSSDCKKGRKASTASGRDVGKVLRQRPKVPVAPVAKCSLT